MLALQQSVVETPPLQLARGGAAAGIRALAARAGAADAARNPDPLLVFEGLLDRLLAAGLASWIVDFAAVVADAASGVSSDDPVDAMLLVRRSSAAALSYQCLQRLGPGTTTTRAAAALPCVQLERYAAHAAGAS